MRTAAIALLIAAVGCAGQEPTGGIAIDRLLIVAPEELTECAALMADEHPELTVEVIALPDISDGPATPEEIDEFVELYEGGHGGLALMLVGIHQLLPGFEATVASTTEVTWSDRPYAELPDGRTVPVGRIPVADERECAAYLGRPTDIDSGERNVVVFFGNEPEISYAHLFDAELARELGFEPVVLFSPSADELAAAFADENVLAAFYYGHGSYYSNGALNADNAEEILPEGILYFTGGCGFGQPGPEAGSIAEAVTNGLGGTAFGMSDFGGYGYQYQFASELLTQLASAWTVGELQLLALEFYAEIELPPDRIDTTAARHVLYGDPTREF
jgi:hypothetical protein